MNAAVRDPIAAARGCQGGLGEEFRTLELVSFQFQAGSNSSWTNRGEFSPTDEQAAIDAGATAGPVSDSLHTTVVNETDLPDDFVQQAAAHWMTDVYFQENASLAGAQSSFSTYVNDGSLLARHRYRTPTNVIEEMKLARDLAERDDDVRAVIGGLLALAFEHIEHYAKDQKTLELFREIASPRRLNLEHTLEEMYREYLITSSVTTVKLFVPEMLQYSTDDASGEYLANPTKTSVRVLTPRLGILPGENVRVIGSDLFGEHGLAYWPGDDPKLAKFLEEFFSDQTTPARRNEMRKEDPISTTLFLGPVQVEGQQTFLSGTSVTAYLMNPNMVHRTTMAKGYWPYPRPLLAAVFSLLEAKRLLNIMDFALLQGAANYIIVAKKGSDDRPALPQEIVQLRELVRHLGRTGVVVGDHRLQFEILTPRLDDLLAKEKRDLISKHITMALLRKPENVSEEGSALAETEVEWVSRVIESDRRKLIRHIEHFIYHDTVEANPSLFKQHPKIWTPKIILRGTQFFTDLVLKLRDRGDIPRKYAVEAAGFNFGAAVAERQRELAANIDDIMMPTPVPYTVPASVPDPVVGPEKQGPGPQDNNSGRPKGAQTGRPSQDPAHKPRTISRNAGETVKAWREQGMEEPYRMGELTRQILKQYEDTAKEGRASKAEKEIVLTGETNTSGGMTIIPVNGDYEVGELTAIRLAQGLSIYVGHRADGAIVARGLGFRLPEFDEIQAHEMAMEWGFPTEGDES